MARRNQGNKRRSPILIPGNLLLTPPSPHSQRMAQLVFPIPKEGTLGAAHLKKMMATDVAFQARWAQVIRRLPHIGNARCIDGSGLQISKLLRYYFAEYFGRILTHGFGSLPTSFNVVESFMEFNRELMFFDLRHEVEHLLSIGDYFRWYKNGGLPSEPLMLQDVMEEGRVYSYDMACDAMGPFVESVSQQIIAGVSLVRHAHELSCVLLAGENPPLDSDERVRALEKEMDTEGQPTLGREHISAAPELGIKDRYLDGYQHHCRVVVLARFDLRRRQHEVRYINLDQGRWYKVLTDDPDVVTALPATTAQAIAAEMGRYDALFSALTSLIYLPAFFAAVADQTRQLRVVTQLHATRDDERSSRMIKELGADGYTNHRDVRCLQPNFGRADDLSGVVAPPEMQSSAGGFWKIIAPTELGEDKEGNPILGRTWVSRHEIWMASSPSSFMLRFNKPMTGPDPGTVYIQRSAAHNTDLYKVGLTRRSPETRAEELSSSTGVPLPFAVLASWEVPDCAAVEREVHRRLRVQRVNPRREFFCIQLAVLTRTIDAVVRDLSP